MLSRLDSFNRLAPEQAEALLLGACHSRSWAAQMVAGRPYADLAGLQRQAGDVWLSLQPTDWREAAAGHPRIGEPGGTSPELSEQEQAGTAGAPEALAGALADANRLYEERFGQVFLIRAAGRSTAEVLDYLRARLGNDAETELAVAAGEQAEITALRLTKLFGCS